ncbi:hypothetical protein [Candidatus Hamiltonella defensa]|uniref:hypothetical protein n=1 Tax=Candidatus Williamhamiltonella defendens TaxID=138072 RepID=UPI0015835107|nr:hypothetical protein [Candidatus Hamiltonella defensa]
MRYQKIKKSLIRLSVFTLLRHSEALFSIETIEGKKNHTLEKKNYNEGIDIKGQSTVQNKGALSVSSHHQNRPAVKVSEGSILTLKGTQDKLTTLTTSGKNSLGLLASGSGTEVTADKIEMITKSENADVVKADAGATIHIQDSTIITRGGSSPALWSKASTLKISDSHLETTGTDSAILYAGPENNKKTKSLVLQKDTSTPVGTSLCLKAEQLTLFFTK